MTRNEAIKWLIKPVVTSTEIGEIKAKELEAYDMAIEALSADAVPHGRLIDADAFIFELEEWKKNPNNDDSAVDLVNHFIGIIRATPSAEPNCGSCKHYEPRHDVCHAPELVKQVTSKLKNPCNSFPSATEIKKKQIEVGAVADGIYGAETSDKRISNLICGVETSQNLSKPNNTCEVDLISREDALKKWDNLSERGRTEFDQVLMTLPSADRPIKVIAEIKVDIEEIVKRIKEEYEIADRPQGEWIFKTDDESVCEEWECSKCGNWSFVKTSYCPNCGAEMKKEE